MIEGLKRLYSGDFNTMHQEVLLDGTIKVTLTKKGDKKAYRFQVKGLYTENEEVIEYEEANISPPSHILKRMKEAKKNARKPKSTTN